MVCFSFALISLLTYFHLHLGIELRVLCKDATAGGMVLHILEIL